MAKSKSNITPPETTPAAKETKAVKHVHTFRFNIVQYVQVITDSTSEAEALTLAKAKLMNEHFDARRHSRYDGFKKP